MIILTILMILLSLSSSALAAVTGFVARDDGGDYIEYSYEDLLDSYSLKLLGRSNGLYEDFSIKQTFAILYNDDGYIDYEDLLDRYAAAVVNGERFDLKEIFENNDFKKASIPSEIKQAVIREGKITYTAKNIGGGIDGEGSKTRTPIVGSPEATLEQAKLWAMEREAHQRFIDIADLYWEYGRRTGLRPEVLYAQAAHETNFGKYTGQVPPEYNNWAGIKKAGATGDEPEDHEEFATPEDGVRAHFNHMSAYVGLNPIGEPHGRYQVVLDQTWAGAVIHVEDLSGKWAPSAGYHTSVLNLLEQIYDVGTESGSSTRESTENDPDRSDSNDIPQSASVIVEADVLRLRSGPGLDYKIIDRMLKGTVLTVMGNQNEWLKVITPEGKNGWTHGGYVRELSPTGDNLADKLVAIDPGHGGSDFGAVGVSGVREKDINIAVAQHLAAMLQEAGAKVIMTRSGDYSLSNQQRVDTANEAKADIYISIHANAFTSEESNGTETHFCDEKKNSAAGRYLAYQLQRELLASLGLRDRGVKASSFFVLTKTEMPSALVEMAFMSNVEEEKQLTDPAYQKRAAKALFRGLQSYFQYYQ